MKRNVAKKVARRKRRVLKRLERARERRFIRGFDSTSVIGANAVTYELSERVHAIGHGGIGMMLKRARNTGLVDEIDRRVHLLKVHAPYQESDHVMSHVLNMLCGGTRLEQLELLRNNEALLKSADLIPRRRPGNRSTQEPQIRMSSASRFAIQIQQQKRQPMPCTKLDSTVALNRE